MTKDMEKAEVLNAFLPWFSLAMLTAWPSRSSRVCGSVTGEDRVKGHLSEMDVYEST